MTAFMLAVVDATVGGWLCWYAWRRATMPGPTAITGVVLLTCSVALVGLAVGSKQVPPLGPTQVVPPAPTQPLTVNA